ncbi:hypothetical protein DFP72DRAFT_17644 [Ephemerocybe angulata]|uniref:DUF7704 domain-containing protein n=1 Tax=Ephemerocybe angulata TaxID=980116 RepID=A0A8H6MF41_9AGAR|nr:hypothetical protein DFP72DRAFT_17644 [Tulosesus angulatus]
MSPFPALPGVYRILFLYLEPTSTFLPFLIIWGYPGSNWFYNQLVPGSGDTRNVLDARTDMALWHLGNCYFLLALISSCVLRAVRDALRGNPAAQEHIIAAVFLALGIADLTHVGSTIYWLPADLRVSPLKWNATTHGNITAVVGLFAMRVAWYLGVGRSRPWTGKEGRKRGI